MQQRSLLLSVLGSLILTACGGGGGGGTSENTNKQITPVKANQTITQSQSKPQSQPQSEEKDKVVVPQPSINSVPEELREAVKKAKTQPVLGVFTEGTYYVALNNQLIKDGIYDMSKLPEGLSQAAYEVVVQENKDSQPLKVNGTMFIYNQPFSFVQTALVPKELKLDEKEFLNKTSHLWGYPTTKAYLDSVAATAPTSFSYKGEAFDSNEVGKLEYQVVFVTPTEISGSGKITGLTRSGDITLKSANIEERKFNGGDVQWGFVGDASSVKSGDGRYRAALFGPKAEEVAGFARFEQIESPYDVGFGGKRAETPKTDK